MKGGLIAAGMAALAGGASANQHRHAHDLFRKNAATGDVCVPACTTIYSTIVGEMTLVPAKTTTTTATMTNTSTMTLTPTEPATTETVVVIPAPTPEAHTCETPGTYTFPAKTITVQETTTVCAATSTKVPSGTHTIGGVTTVVTTATTVTCPVATVETSGDVTTSTISMTEYVCPSAGTYTVAPTTTTVTEETVVVYPVPTTYVPGTYTAPEQVVTVTETDFVTYCPYTSSGLPTTTPEPTPETTTQPEPTPEPETTSAKPEPKPEPTSVKPEPKPEPTSTKSEPKPEHTNKPSGGLQGSNDHYGITYTPYEPSNGNCKSSSEVDKDIAKLKRDGFSVVRVYSTDCNTLESVGGACKKHGMEMITGVFVKGGNGCSYNTPDIKEQIDSLAAWGQWDLVKLMVVGNEAIMNGFCTASELSELIKTVKSKCSSYTGPYTISETLNIWQRSEVSSAICSAVDVTGANIHPFFNSGVSASEAGEFALNQLDILKKICPGNDVINLESGWPTDGHCNGRACPGQKEQAEAIKSIRKSCGDKTVFFSYENDEWKEAGDCGCEKSWGSAAVFSISADVDIGSDGISLSLGIGS